MAKKPPKSRIPSSASKPKQRKTPSAEAEPKPAGGVFRFVNRELVESIVIAFVLAFLFRTFQAEAFVIPTGSMANTLVGRHKDVVCPKCSQRYGGGASSEVDNATGRKNGNKVLKTQCPNCGYVADVTPNQKAVRSKSYSGDRILVGKFAYESGIGEPERWDVAVFKFPGNATVNYIKRLVGLPGEELHIKNGDIHVKRPGEQDFAIARKSHAKVRAMMQPVHDNDHVPVELYQNGWPLRWTSDMTGTQWIPSPDYRSYKTDGPAIEPAWLRYSHTLAGKRQWMRLEGDEFGEFDPDKARAFLITDANAYNSSVTSKGDPSERYEADDRNNMDMPLSGLGMNWVSDLIVDCQLQVISADGEAILELIDSGRVLRCTFDLATGKATLSIDGLGEFAPTAQTNVKGPGTYTVGFANVDNKLYLWVDGDPVEFPAEFDQPTEYPSLGDRIPTPADLKPIAIGAINGAELAVSDLKVHRDIYYIAMSRENSDHLDDVRWELAVDESQHRPQSRAEFFSSPKFWRDQLVPGVKEHENADLFRKARTRNFKIDEDRFFMLGDNSARSADGRLWTVPIDKKHPKMGHTVDRKLLIGKALFIYWPHSLDEIFGTGLWFPKFPNFADMKFVR